MIEEKSWQEFRDSGLFWWINTILHTFGWAIVMVADDDGNLTKVYPARVKFRGFDNAYNAMGYVKVSEFMKDHAEELLKEAKN